MKTEKDEDYRIVSELSKDEDDAIIHFSSPLQAKVFVTVFTTLVFIILILQIAITY